MLCNACFFNYFRLKNETNTAVLTQSKAVYAEDFLTTFRFLGVVNFHRAGVVTGDQGIGSRIGCRITYATCLVDKHGVFGR
jgi:hypothetical protein